MHSPVNSYSPRTHSNTVVSLQAGHLPCLLEGSLSPPHLSPLVLFCITGN